jgi:hypothetical protein
MNQKQKIEQFCRQFKIIGMTPKLEQTVETA